MSIYQCPRCTYGPPGELYQRCAACAKAEASMREQMAMTPAELEQARADFDAGLGIPLEDFKAMLDARKPTADAVRRGFGP